MLCTRTATGRIHRVDEVDTSTFTGWSGRELTVTVAYLACGNGFGRAVFEVAYDPATSLGDFCWKCFPRERDAWLGTP